MNLSHDTEAQSSASISRPAVLLSGLTMLPITAFSDAL